jgi:hypothetical protein
MQWVEAGPAQPCDRGAELFDFPLEHLDRIHLRYLDGVLGGDQGTSTVRAVDLVRHLTLLMPRQPQL